MIFGDNGGSGHFHNQFMAMMRRVLPTIDPVPVPLDDVIHRIPYQIPFLPYVAPHGDRWPWDGRLMAAGCAIITPVTSAMPGRMAMPG
ncbi:MAG: hypothetical protein CM1200mP2_02120 [Planctomycetaceae bacterium]|nr:MAG: hypothetical protein CM1200mP2_02120 [Planctomycetaceae bacterium]